MPGSLLRALDRRASERGVQMLLSVGRGVMGPTPLCGAVSGSSVRMGDDRPGFTVIDTNTFTLG